MERSRRINGLEYPYTPTQLSTWVYLPTLIVEFFLFASPLLPISASIPISVVFFITAIGSAYNAYTAMYIDPSDPRLPFDHHDDDDDGGEMNTNDNNCPWDPNEPTKQCWLCDIQVGEKSMHCKFCNKCVDHFDHHCMWLNTCVGKANYKYFFRTMVWITIMLTIHGSVQLALVLDIYLGNGTTKSRAEDWLNTGGGDTTTLAVVIVMCVFVFMDVVALSLILQLLFFHLRLQKEGLSTYEFIVRDNKRKREQAQKDSLLEQKRNLAILKAQEEGRSKDYMQLRYGGLLRRHCGMDCCDPLIKEEREREKQEKRQQQMRTDAAASSSSAENKRLAASDHPPISSSSDNDEEQQQQYQNGHATNDNMNGGNDDN